MSDRGAEQPQCESTLRDVYGHRYRCSLLADHDGEHMKVEVTWNDNEPGVNE